MWPLLGAIENQFRKAGPKCRNGKGEQEQVLGRTQIDNNELEEKRTIIFQVYLG